MPDCALDQDKKVSRGCLVCGETQLLKDRLRRARPARAFVVVEEPACAKPTVDLAAQLAKIPFATRCRKQDVAFNVRMAIDSGAHDLAQIIGRQATHDLVYVL
jgi:hypothetical protein